MRQGILPVEMILSQEASILLVKSIAEAAGIRLSGFISDSDLELYFDLALGKADSCYLAKGWAEPGFRIAALISLPRRMYVSDDSLSLLANSCAVQGVALCRNLNVEREDWTLESVIYHSGFNAETLRNSADAIIACETYVNAFLRSHVPTVKKSFPPT